MSYDKTKGARYQKQWREHIAGDRKRIEFYLPVKTIDRLDAYAKNLQSTRSKIIREWIQNLPVENLTIKSEITESVISDLKDTTASRFAELEAKLATQQHNNSELSRKLTFAQDAADDYRERFTAVAGDLEEARNRLAELQKHIAEVEDELAQAIHRRQQAEAHAIVSVNQAADWKDNAIDTATENGLLKSELKLVQARIQELESITQKRRKVTPPRK